MQSTIVENGGQTLAVSNACLKHKRAQQNLQEGSQRTEQTYGEDQEIYLRSIMLMTTG